MKFDTTLKTLLANHLALLVLGGVLLGATGCVVAVVGAAAAGATTVAYVRGELKSVEAAPLDRTWNATIAAMKDLEFAIIDRSKDGLSAKLIARGAGDRRIEIRLFKSSEKMTEVRIRVSTFGNEVISRQVLEKIKQHL